MAASDQRIQPTRDDFNGLERGCLNPEELAFAAGISTAFFLLMIFMGIGAAIVLAAS